jgi:penicillin-binding protein 1A
LFLFFLKMSILVFVDDIFYRHCGFYYAGFARAVVSNFVSGRRGQGGSTITMQVARTFFLSSERSYVRKMYEIALAYKIESSLSKDRILEVYANQIFLGQRAYGFAAASQVYFGKKLRDVTVAEVATLAGLPVAPATYNPFVNPKRAKARQQYVLGRMLQLGYIDKATHDAALAQELRPRPAAYANDELPRVRLHAEYAAELARQLVFEVFRDETYTRGLNVYTTLRKEDQEVAYAALRRQVLDYDRKYGYRGPEAFIELEADPAVRDQRIEDALIEAIDSPNLLPAVVLEASPKQVRVAVQGGATVDVGADGLRFVTPSLSPKAQPNRRIVPGAVVRITRNDKSAWEIVQLPQVEAAFVAAGSKDGAVRALVGGFDFNLNKFNHVTQAWRQPGSAFKPFVYSAALERGFTPASLINDAPIVLGGGVGTDEWRPQNINKKFYGPTPLREALVRSQNLVSVRLLRATGIGPAMRHIAGFGFSPEATPPNLTFALGSGQVTPLEMTRAFAVFANGGFLITPHVIERVTDGEGREVFIAQAPVACVDCPGTTAAPQAITPANAFVMTDIMLDVIQRGTAQRAKALGRSDLAGKTGTTSDRRDAWFVGFNGDVAAAAWIGFDQERTLGDNEEGGRTALPMWVSFMEEALRDRPENRLPEPPGVVRMWVNRSTGQPTTVGAGGALFEAFLEGHVPDARAASFDGELSGEGVVSAAADESIF